MSSLNMDIHYRLLAEKKRQSCAYLRLESVSLTLNKDIVAQQYSYYWLKLKT